MVAAGSESQKPEQANECVQGLSLHLNLRERAGHSDPAGASGRRGLEDVNLPSCCEHWWLQSSDYDGDCSAEGSMCPLSSKSHL